MYQEFNKMMLETLGELGSEAVIDAINYYLTHNKDFACEEDKLVLLNILFDSPYTDYIMPDFQAIRHFHITFDGFPSGEVIVNE